MASEEEILNDLLGALRDADIGLGPEGDSDDSDLYDAAASLQGTDYEEDDEAWKNGLDELLMSAENLNQETEQKADVQRDADVTQLIDNMPGSDEDLNEINELLKKSDSNEAIKDDTSSSRLSNQEQDPEETDPKKEKKKKKRRFPWGKKRKEKEDLQQEGQSDGEPSEEKSGEENRSESPASGEQKPKEMSLRDIEKEPDKGKKEKKNKKKREKGEENQDGFLKRFSEILFGEDEEEEQEKKEEKPESENDELLKQLEKDNKAGSGKKKAKDKKEKKAKKPKKEKKPKEKKKKEKKPKAEKEREKEPPSKPVGKKNLFLALIFGLSVLAAVLLLNIALSEFSLKQNVESAYDAGNYKKVYQLLYGKSLNEEETQILGRATVVLQLQRKLDSYEFYKESGDDLRALDALIKGVAGYQELAASDTYGASEELLRIYQVILEHLNLDYGVSEETAIEINSYDNRNYSRSVHAIAGGNSLSEPAAETGVPEAEEGPQDILPEEEDIIDLDTSDEGV